MSQEGYLMIDHRASPGIPEDIARMFGLDSKHCGEGKMLEQATMTCLHCKNAVVKNPDRIRARGFCAQCNGYICDTCHAATHDPLYSHLSFDQKVEVTKELAAKGMLLGSNSLLLTP